MPSCSSYGALTSSARFSVCAVEQFSQQQQGRASSSRTAAVAGLLLGRRAPPPPRQVSSSSDDDDELREGRTRESACGASFGRGHGRRGRRWGCPAPRHAPHAGAWRIPAAPLFGPCSRLEPVFIGLFITDSRLVHNPLTNTSRFISVSCSPHAYAAINRGAMPANPPLIVRELLAQSRHNHGMLTNRC